MGADIDLYSSSSGTPGPALVFLHGFGGCHALWHDIAKGFASSHRVIAYDLPGHGRSLAAQGAGDARAAARSVLNDLASRGVGVAHVVGHSMGGAIAVLMALADPGRVASLTLLAPGGFGPAISGVLLRRYALAAEPAEIAACLAAMSGPHARANADAITLLSVMRARPGQRAILLEIAETISRDDRQGVIPADRMAGLSMPASLAWGTLDPVLPFEQALTLPGPFRLHALPGVGHMLPEEVPTEVIDIIKSTIA